MLHLIILATVRKGYKRTAACKILKWDGLLAGKNYVYRREVMTQCHARISHENLPVPLKLENIIIS